MTTSTSASSFSAGGAVGGVTGGGAGTVGGGGVGTVGGVTVGGVGLGGLVAKYIATPPAAISPIESSIFFNVINFFYSRINITF